MKTLKTKPALILFSFMLIHLSCSINCVAQGKIEMDQYVQEFFIGKTVFPQEKNEVQFTLKPIFTKSEYWQVSIPFSVEYGITDRLQVEVEVPYLISSVSDGHTIRGTGITELGILYNIIKPRHSFSLSAGVEIPLRTSGRQIRAYDPETSWEVFAVAARQFGRIQVHGNLTSEISEGAVMLNYGVASAIQFGKCNATFELSSNKEEQRIFYFAPGLIWNQRNGLEFGLAISKSIQAASNGWSLVGMLIYEF